jgi:hypothetical protein
MHKVLESIKEVVNTSKKITINEKNIKLFCSNNFIRKDIHWLKFSPIDLMSLDFQSQLKLFFILDSISFCFWNLPKWKIEYNKQIFDGSWGMTAALAKAIDNNIPILDFHFLSQITTSEFNKIVEDENKLALREQRVQILNELGTKMVNTFNANPLNILESVNYDAIELMELILKSFKSFEDQEYYNGRIIHFNKKAQLLTSDINYILELNGEPSLKNIEQITACADYKMPFILREFGILEYSESLSRIIDNRIVIEKGAIEEIEIRAFTIYAIEKMREEYKRNSIHNRTTHINDFLWLVSQIKNPKQKPYHLTLTTSY